MVEDARDADTGGLFDRQTPQQRCRDRIGWIRGDVEEQAGFANRVARDREAEMDEEVRVAAVAVGEVHLVADREGSLGGDGEGCVARVVAPRGVADPVVEEVDEREQGDPMLERSRAMIGARLHDRASPREVREREVCAQRGRQRAVRREGVAIVLGRECVRERAHDGVDILVKHRQLRELSR
jgi:ribosomal protein S14